MSAACQIQVNKTINHGQQYSSNNRRGQTDIDLNKTFALIKQLNNRYELEITTMLFVTIQDKGEIDIPDEILKKSNGLNGVSIRE